MHKKTSFTYSEDLLLLQDAVHKTGNVLTLKKKSKIIRISDSARNKEFTISGSPKTIQLNRFVMSIFPKGNRQKKQKETTYLGKDSRDDGLADNALALVINRSTQNRTHTVNVCVVYMFRNESVLVRLLTAVGG